MPRVVSSVPQKFEVFPRPLRNQCLVWVWPLYFMTTGSSSMKCKRWTPSKTSSSSPSFRVLVSAVEPLWASVTPVSAALIKLFRRLRQIRKYMCVRMCVCETSFCKNLLANRVYSQKCWCVVSLDFLYVLACHVFIAHPLCVWVTVFF